MSRGYNFGAGPAMLPTEVLVEAQREFLNWQHTGMSVLEIGHRTEEFKALMQEAESLLREILSIPSCYQVLFLGGAARLQFAMIPLNLLEPDEQAAYLVSGLWSEMAFKEANRLGKAYCVNKIDKNYHSIAARSEWRVDANSRYFYYTPNETVNGIQLKNCPEVDAPVIADMTSCLLMEPLDIDRYSLIFAGAQKNIANAGLTIVIVRDDLLHSIQKNDIPTMLDYRTHVDNHSLYATPPTFNCYLAAKMFHWVKKQGGITALNKKSGEAARLLYNFIDDSTSYECAIDIPYRSQINVCFRLKKSYLERQFLLHAQQKGLLALAGHRTIGGLRASLYNSMPLDGVIKLIDFMEQFAKEYAND